MVSRLSVAAPLSVAAAVLVSVLVSPLPAGRHGATTVKVPRIRLVPPAEFIQLISGTFRGAWADAFYVQGVLALTEETPNRHDRVRDIQSRLRLATILDPRLVQAYFFGGVVIGQDRETIRMGIAFLQEGLERSPQEWRLPYWIGFGYYALGDYLEATAYYDRAARLPDAPAFLRSGQPYLYYLARRVDLGITYLEGLLHSIQDKGQLEWITLKLRWLKGMAYLEQKAEEFTRIYGAPPKRLEQLVESGLIDAIPEDPFLGGYVWDLASGSVKSRPRSPR